MQTLSCDINHAPHEQNFDAFTIQGITTGERISLISKTFQQRASQRRQSGIDQRIQRASGIYITPSIYDLIHATDPDVREIEATHAVRATANIINSAANAYTLYRDLIIPNHKVLSPLQEQAQEGIDAARRHSDVFNTQSHSNLVAAAYQDCVLFTAIMASLKTQRDNADTFKTSQGQIKKGQPYFHQDPNDITGLGQLHGEGAHGILDIIPGDSPHKVERMGLNEARKHFTLKQASEGSISIFTNEYYHASGHGERIAIGEMHRRLTP